MKKVLFSPVGRSDPFNERTKEEGPLLHIIRHYKPKKVYLFFTLEMLEEKCKIQEEILKLEPIIEIKIIETNIEDPSDFNMFQDFTKYINNIRNENPDENILLNISSGTPQIISSLCLEVVSHREELFPIQVLNPEKTKRENRCVEPDLISIKKVMLKEQVKELVRSYEYKGAYTIVENNISFFTKSTFMFIEHAYSRSIQAEIKGINKDFERFYPFKEGEEKEVLEFYLVAELLRKKGQITDFILRFYAIIETLLERKIDRTLKGGLESISQNTEYGWEIIESKFKDNEPLLYEKINKERTENPKEKNLPEVVEGKKLTLSFFEHIAKHLEIEYYNELYKLTGLRGRRNKAAHTLKAITEKDINVLIGGKKDSKYISDLLKNLIISLYGIKEDYFGTFEYIKESVLEKIEVKR